MSRPPMSCMRLLALIGAMLLGACTTPPRPLPVGQDGNPGAGSGYLLTSISADAGHNARFVFRDLHSGAEWPLTAHGGGLLDRSAGFDDEDGSSGRLLLTDLAPGVYELVGWGLLAGRRGHQQRWLEPAGLPPIPFLVRAGEITYIGNLHVTVLHDAGTVLPALLRPVAAAAADIRSRAERDLSLLRQRHGELAELPVRPSVKTRPEWTVTVRHRGAGL